MVTTLFSAPSGFSYEFRRWDKRLFLLDSIIAIVAFFLFGIFRPDYVVIVVYFSVVPYLIITHRIILFYHLAISSAVALFWVVLAQDFYNYNYDFSTIAGLNSFSLFSWAIGLFATYTLYRQHRYFPKEWIFMKHLFIFTIFYWTLLILTETAAYHLFNIQIITAIYSGLPICDCLHAPLWIKATYFIIGPVFFTACYLFGLENPHARERELYVEQH